MEFRTVMTQREDPPGPATDSPPAPPPPVKIEALPWWQMVGVRVVRVYLQCLMGFLVVGGTGLGDAAGVPLDQFGGSFIVAVKLAVAPAVVTLIQNTLEIVTKLDVTRPELRA